MRRRPLLILLGLLIAVLVAVLVERGGNPPAGTGSGDAAQQARALPPFTGVDLTGFNNVTVRVGAKQSVIVHADRNLLARVTTRVRSGTLEIGTTPGNLNAKSPMFVAVSVPALDSLRLQGAGNISVTGIDSQSLGVALPGSGNVEATGTATQLDVRISGAGTALLRGLVARDASAEVSGDGSIMLTATRSLDAMVSGSGTILYGGGPARVTQSVTGSGAITAE
jgi:hypothetical protein